MHRRKGFTLIELLVVIAIIAILAAILFPVFAKAREKARQSSCISNVKQIMTAVNMYSQDYDEVLPCAYTWGYPDPWVFWPHQLEPYIKSWDVYDCPSNPLKGRKNVNYHGTIYPILPTYAMTAAIIAAPGISMAAVTTPASKWLLGGWQPSYLRKPLRLVYS